MAGLLTTPAPQRTQESGSPRKTRGGRGPGTVRAFRATPFTYATLIVVAAILSMPLVFVGSIALSSDATVNTNSFTLFPTEFHWENFSRVFGSELPMGRFLINSVIISLCSVAGQMLSSGLVGYAFARLRAPGKNTLFLIVIATMMIPTQITMIPQFILFRDLGWVNTYLPLIVPNFFSNAFNVFLVRQFVSRLPSTLDEAAMVDGLGFFGIYRRIMLPMLWPVLIAIGIFTLTHTWGDFMGPLIYLNDESKMPLSLGIQYITSTSAAGQSPAWNLVMVGSVLLALPMIIVYYLGQKYLYEMDISGGSAGVK
ncbi:MULTISPECIES: carbohydrate ABC transporter permease [unclassified Streptomyces]|uniref:carbohydrate ABC transporter permease n=1 Tax=unclassified Streptomyces TaxID=2593676 RepID=UPI0023657788|nr:MULTISPECIES: carbohydrate ABC transporter permease [unclassified Streptomyces]MDF3147037.1 carbohydrate ABC transporter permease [Streptomyces sp. T21Q-yed]WDF35915.1 carbohydrate ABC transporter permease [Streptomyces sp. T12]